MSPQAEDHRTRVGAARREKMRARLIEAGTLVFAERGPEAALIDHVIAEAGVSRGTFYNYFRTTEELLAAAKDTLAHEMYEVVAGAVCEGDAPAEKFAAGLMGFVDLARRYPLILDFMARLGLRELGTSRLIPVASTEFVGRLTDFEAVLPPRLALDVLEGATIAVLRRMMTGEEVDLASFVAAMLRMLGLDRAEAARIAAAPFAPMVVPETSLILRSAAVRSDAWTASHPR